MQPPSFVLQGKHLSLMQGVFHGSRDPRECIRLCPGISTYLNLDLKHVSFSISSSLFPSSPFSVSGINHTDSILLESLLLWILTFLDLWEKVTLTSSSSSSSLNQLDASHNFLYLLLFAVLAAGLFLRVSPLLYCCNILIYPVRIFLTISWCQFSW